MEKEIQNQLTQLENEMYSMLTELNDRKNEIDKVNNACTDLKSDLKSSNEKLLSVQQYVIENIPPAFKEKKRELEKVNVRF